MISLKPLALLFFFLIGTQFYDGLRAQSEIIGLTTLEKILEEDPVYQIYINRYQPDANAVEFLQAAQDSVTLQIFMGTWCRESKKYLPGLIKTLTEADSDFITINYIGVDAQKKFPKTFLKTFDIKYIPTVLVLKGNEEVGRIEEAPKQLIEIDLVKILSKSINSEN